MAAVTPPEVRMEQHDLQERAPLLELDDQWRRERPGPDGEEERTDVEVAAHVLVLNTHGIIVTPSST